jgi:hypothetical protein
MQVENGENSEYAKLNGPRKDGYMYNGELIKYKTVIAEDGATCYTLPKKSQPYPKPESPNVLCVIKKSYADFYKELGEIGREKEKRLINVIQMPEVKERAEFKAADEIAKKSREDNKPIAKKWKEENPMAYQAFKDYRKKRSELKQIRDAHRDSANNRKFPIEAFNTFAKNVVLHIEKQMQVLKTLLDGEITEVWNKSQHIEKVVEPVKMAKKDYQTDDSDSDSD